MELKKGAQLYEGKAKKVYATDNADYVIVSYKDDATALNGLKKGTIEDKGEVNNIVSNYLFKMLEEKGVPTHFVEELSPRETVVKKVSSIKLEAYTQEIYAGESVTVTPTVLPATGSHIVLTETSANDTVLFKWQRADFGFPAAITYAVQIAKPDTYFESAVKI